MRCNTVTFTAADGRELSLPLDELLKRDAIIASRVNGEDISSVMGAGNQLWAVGLPARYFIRDIVDIRLSCEDEPPGFEPFEGDELDFSNRPNVSVQAPFAVRLGHAIHFEGYADDYDKAITAIHFSLDEGRHWTAFPLEGTQAGRWVRWVFDYKPQNSGRHHIMVKAKNEDGKVSPTAAVHEFEVFEEA